MWTKNGIQNTQDIEKKKHETLTLAKSKRAASAKSKEITFNEPLRCRKGNRVLKPASS